MVTWNPAFDSLNDLGNVCRARIPYAKRYSRKRGYDYSLIPMVYIFYGRLTLMMGASSDPFIAGFGFMLGLVPKKHSNHWLAV